jgi:rare lipoprotein A
MFRTSMTTVAAALLMLVSAGAAQATSGLAAYNEHTSAMVTASRYEPRGSLLNVMNPRTGRSVLVRVNDRGPFNGNRILDLSTGAFAQLFGGLGRGVGPITYTVVSRGAAGAGTGSRVLASRSGFRRRYQTRHYSTRRRSYRRYTARRYTSRRYRSHRARR